MFYNMRLFIFSAPGDYRPEKCASILLDNSPKYTFGMKTDTEKPANTPGTRYN